MDSAFFGSTNDLFPWKPSRELLCIMENIHAMDHAVFKKEMGSKVGFVLILLPSFFFSVKVLASSSVQAL